MTLDLAMSIEDAWLSVGTTTVLRREGLRTLADLNGADRQVVKKMYGMGRERMKELDSFFSEHGLSWASPLPKCCKTCGQPLPDQVTNA